MANARAYPSIRVVWVATPSTHIHHNRHISTSTTTTQHHQQTPYTHPGMSDPLPKSLVDVLILFGIHIAVTSGGVLAFLAFRPKHRVVYAPNEKKSMVSHGYVPGSSGRRQRGIGIGRGRGTGRVRERVLCLTGNKTHRAALPKLRSGLFALLADVVGLSRLHADRVKAVQLVGVDGYVLLRFLALISRLVGWLAVAALLILIPINVGGGRVDDRERWEADWRARTTISDKLALVVLSPLNLRRGSAFFWASVVAVYVFSMAAVLMLRVLLRDAVTARSLFVPKGAASNSAVTASSRDTPASDSTSERTLLITDLSPSLRNDAAFADFIARGSAVQPSALSVARNLGDLPKNFEAYTADVARFEDAFTEYMKALSKNPRAPRPMTRLPPTFTKKVDALDSLANKLWEREEKVYEARMGTMSQPTSHCGFVLYLSVAEAEQAYRDLKKSTSLKNSRSVVNASIHHCPREGELRYENAGIEPKVRKVRVFVSAIFLIVIVLGWSSFSSIVMLLAKLDQLQKLSPKLVVWIQNHSFANFIFTTLLPPLIFVVLQILLLILLRRVIQTQGYISVSKEERKLMGWLFAFTLWNTIIMNGAGVLFEKGKQIFGGNTTSVTQNGNSVPEDLLDTTMNALVQNSSFFISYIITNFSGYAIAIVQIGPLIVTTLRRRFTAVTPRQLDALLHQPIEYALIISTLLASFFMTLLFSIISPLILLFSFINFFIAKVCITYLVVYVFETEFETGGKWVKGIFHSIMTALLVFQLVTLAFIRAYAGVAQGQSLVVIPPVLATIIAWIYFSRKFNPLIQAVPLPPNTKDNSIKSSSQIIDDSETALIHASLVRPLEPKWLWPSDAKLVSQYHSPKYSCFEDYIQSRNSPTKYPIIGQGLESGMGLGTGLGLEFESLDDLTSAKKYQQHPQSRHTRHSESDPVTVTIPSATSDAAAFLVTIGRRESMLLKRTSTQRQALSNSRIWDEDAIDENAEDEEAPGNAGRDKGDHSSNSTVTAYYYNNNNNTDDNVNISDQNDENRLTRPFPAAAAAPNF